ncbi:hypothetical protein HY771_01305 [Candidatus Uhrbacteria bacterium]|nr:hypothetical protein [Candidatus Uhrbacteria bacterium]
MQEQYFAKSFEEDFVLKTLNGKKKEKFQSIDDIIRTNTLRLNTKSFGREKRLACSFLHKNYLNTYRAQGLIFKTRQKPDYIYPFDLVLLSDAKKIIVQYYRIKENLHLYYNHKLIPGFEKFVFKDIKKLLNKFPSLDSVWKKVNQFRVENGYKPLPKQKHKLIEYNEVIFHKPVKITPVAIFGYKKNTKKIAKQYHLPHFVSAKKFFESLN